MLPDTVLGHYRILSPLGKGGMGEVYAAEDTRLHRTVALKLLPQAMAADPDLRRRFEREAQAVAALNHPNIVTIHSVENVSGVLFLTMEAVEGRTLKELIGRDGVPIDTLLRVSIAISDALAAAHQRGITHRDLKPGNVMVTGDGRVKVLDFGLAKLRETERDAAADQPTKLRSDDLTGEGRIIGTVAYMSPEQAEGKPVDPRSDIFSLGVMLHEMSAGERPFRGDTDISVISSILKDTPSAITDIKPDLPPGLARIVRRCLAKDPGRRYQTATDVRNDLEELKQDLDSGISQAAPASGSKVVPHAPRMRGRAALVAAAIVALALAAGGLFAWNRYGRAAGGEGTAFTADRFTRLTESGQAYLAALSPDARYVVHVRAENGSASLWIRQTATTSDVRIVEPADIRYDALEFSPDGNYVYFVTYPRGSGIASLYRIPVLGGTPVRVLEDIDSGPAFSPDGSRIAFVRGDVERGLRHLMIASADGTGERSLAAADGAMRFQNETPAWSPDGRTILVPASEGQVRFAIMSVAVETGEIRQQPGTWYYTRGVSWMPDGRSYLMDGVDGLTNTQVQLFQVTYPGGESRRITADLNGYTGVSLSDDGRMLATVQTTTEASIWVVPTGAKGEETELRVPARSAGTNGIAWTGDGRIVFSGEVSGLPQLFIASADGTGARQLTARADMAAFSPAVSIDDRWIYFVGADENVRIWRIGIDGSNPAPLTTGGQPLAPVVSPDGAWVYFGLVVDGVNRPMRMRPDGTEQVKLADDLFQVRDVSPDGTQLVGTTWSSERRRSECAIMPAAGGAIRLLGDIGVARGGLVGTCRFSPDGQSIGYAAVRDGRTDAYMQPLSGGPERQLTNTRHVPGTQVFYGAWSRDGRLAFSRGARKSDVVLIATRQE